MSGDLARSPPRPTSYIGDDADNRRWEGFAFRPGDIVISTPSKCGTTWTQLLCALLVFDTVDLPAPLAELSPWLDMRTRPLDEVRRALDAQTHRRFIKTHTPLDGLPIDDRVTYLCVARDPRDAFVSLAHHRANMIRPRMVELVEAAGYTWDGDRPGDASTDVEHLRKRLARWIEAPPPDGGTDEPLAAIIHHVACAWDRRHRANVALLHFADYVADLPAELTHLADLLGIERDEGRIAELAQVASIDQVRTRAGDFAPNATQGLWHDDAAFFRSGRIGDWRTVFTAADERRYDERLAELVADSELVHWIHHGRRGGPIAPEAD